MIRPKRRTRRQSPEEQAAFMGEVVAVARKLFAESGYQSVSLRPIAAKVGCTPMALYRYFPNKLALLRFIWADIFRELFAATEAALEVGTAPEPRLRGYCRAWIEYWLAHPENYRAVFLNQDAGTDKPMQELAGLEQPFFADSDLVIRHMEKLGAVFVEAMEAGTFRELSPKLYVEIAFASLLGLIHGLITIPEFSWSPADELGEVMIDALIRGFRAPPAGAAAKRKTSLPKASQSHGGKRRRTKQ